MNGSIDTRRDLELEGSPKRRENNTMMPTCSSKSNIPLYEPLYPLQYPWIGVYITCM
jgi:hypothetical protein